MADESKSDDAQGDESGGPTALQRLILENIRKDAEMPQEVRMFVYHVDPEFKGANGDDVVKRFPFLVQTHECDDRACTFRIAVMPLDAVRHEKETAQAMLQFALLAPDCRAEFVKQFGSKLTATPGMVGIKWIDSRFTMALLRVLRADCMIEIRIANMMVGVTDHVHTSDCDCKQVVEGLGDRAVTAMLCEPGGRVRMMAMSMRVTDDGTVKFGDIMDGFDMHQPDDSPDKVN